MLLQKINKAIMICSIFAKKQQMQAIRIAILDGVLYIPTHNKMYKALTYTYKDENIMSALVLRDFLYSI